MVSEEYKKAASEWAKYSLFANGSALVLCLNQISNNSSSPLFTGPTIKIALGTFTLGLLFAGMHMFLNIIALSFYDLHKSKDEIVRAREDLEEKLAAVPLDQLTVKQRGRYESVLSAYDKHLSAFPRNPRKYHVGFYLAKEGFVGMSYGSFMVGVFVIVDSLTLRLLHS